MWLQGANDDCGFGIWHFFPLRIVEWVWESESGDWGPGSPGKQHLNSNHQDDFLTRNPTLHRYKSAFKLPWVVLDNMWSPPKRPPQTKRHGSVEGESNLPSPHRRPRSGGCRWRRRWSRGTRRRWRTGWTASASGRADRTSRTFVWVAGLGQASSLGFAVPLGQEAGMLVQI